MISLLPALSTKGSSVPSKARLKLSKCRVGGCAEAILTKNRRRILVKIVSVRGPDRFIKMNAVGGIKMKRVPRSPAKEIVSFSNLNIELSGYA